MDLEHLLDIAVGHQEKGELDQAESIYRGILETNPNDADVLQMLGMVRFTARDPAGALEYLQKSVAINPRAADAQLNLGSILAELGRPLEAAGAFRKAIVLEPSLVEAHNNLGTALRSLGQWDQAAAAYRRALELQPEMPELHYNVAGVFWQKNDLAGAINAYRKAIDLKPDFLDAHLDLGKVSIIAKRAPEAIEPLRRYLTDRPASAQPHYLLALALQNSGDLDTAIEHYRRSVEVEGRNAKVWSDLGHALWGVAKMEESLAAMRRAIEVSPDFAEAHSNLVYAAHFSPALTPRMVYQEHVLWNYRHAEPLKKEIRPHTNDPNPQRRLRIGYVSPDFRRHAEAFFTVPLLEHHDHDRFEIFGYYGMQESDEITARIRGYTDHWQGTESLNDSQLAEVIREDGIDILIDLTMHMAHNRMLVFARKPAPVQITWLAYPGTTGLSTMDYRLTDSYLDEPGCDESVYAERSIRLPDYWLCFDPLNSAPPAPPREQGPIRFGSLNNPCKLNEQTLQLWCRLLHEEKDSRLIVSILAGSHGQRIATMVKSHGIDLNRIDFVGRMGREEYLRQYHRIDIAVDPLPYNGITTTCDALWMGVPVVTLVGTSAAGRAGLGIMANMNLRQWVAWDADEFVRIARELAADLTGLAEWRKTLRTRIESSPIMDARRFTKNVETVYRDVWRKWCASGKSGT